MSRINVPATHGHGSISSSKLIVIGIAASIVSVVAFVLVAQPFQGSGNGSPEISTALAPSFSAPVANGSLAVADAIATHENGIEAQFGRQSPEDRRTAEIARAIAEHDNAIAALGAAFSRIGHFSPEIQRAIAEHDNLIESYVS